MALSGEQAPEMMSAAAGLHSNDARRQRGREGHEGVAANAPAQYDFAGPVQSNDAAAVLAEINSQNCDLHGSAPILNQAGQLTPAAEEGQAIP